ncbi:Copper amine oxidase N-terminal domain-containing protein [Abditibacterium utsteinense]|uniref:Copper amine oxidase N-terminal domain-containing protein n=1 Tax=Abditibacterium utsteinense TaxID=1960156 RepID=A0A2S8SW59_9BACT|nr:copper amine oxidase N-terminal domain-containing protein [Abditibacterium utsteinense]PQV65030.1 Copper amine oxidase N-terminal domain-containing protein [Abditibacterium utsteinense]
MKLNIQKSGLLTVALGASLAGTASAQNAPRLVLNGQPFRTQVAPITQDNRVLVPLRDIFEGLGARVNYNDRNRTITARRQGTVVRMELGSRRAEVNGQVVRLDVPATTVYGSTMVPLRFVSEALGARVNYNPTRNVIRINDRDGNLNDGRMNDGRMNDGRMNDGRMNDGRMNDGRMNDGRMNDGRMNDGRMNDGRMNDGRMNGDNFGNR